MTFDPDDPRLTAFALGELDDADRAAVEALVAGSPEANRFVVEVREMASLLSETLQAEPAPGLSIVQRIDLDAQLVGKPSPRNPQLTRIPWRRVLSGLAAGLTLAVGGYGVGRLSSPMARSPVSGSIAMLEPQAQLRTQSHTMERRALEQESQELTSLSADLPRFAAKEAQNPPSQIAESNSLPESPPNVREAEQVTRSEVTENSLALAFGQDTPAISEEESDTFEASSPGARMSKAGTAEIGESLADQPEDANLVPMARAAGTSMESNFAVGRIPTTAPLVPAAPPGEVSADPEESVASPPPQRARGEMMSPCADGSRPGSGNADGPGPRSARSCRPRRNGRRNGCNGRPAGSAVLPRWCGVRRLPRRHDDQSPRRETIPGGED